MVWHLDVGSSHPGAGEGPKGWAVRPLKWHASWVQNVVRQFGIFVMKFLFKFVLFNKLVLHVFDPYPLFILVSFL